MTHLLPNEIRDITKLLEQGKPLPDKYRFLLFGDNREVELVWNGKTDEVTNVVLPFQTIEHIDEPREESEHIKLQQDLFDASGRQIKGWTNKLIWGDNKLILSALKNGPMRKQIEDAGGIKLIYIDPPFDVGADFSLNIQIGDEEFTKRPSVIEEIAYRDTWGKGADSFIAMIYERIKLMHELLADDGSIYVHAGIQVNHYIRLALEEIFGKDNLVSEIIWSYGSPSGGRAAGSKLVKVHEYILHFAKNYNNRIENKIYLPYNEKYIKDWFKWTDENGRVYRQRIRGKHENGSPIYERQYLDESPGEPASTVWKDIKQIYADPRAYKSNQGEYSEILGYPTQKPESLIERIITASSNPGDLIADFFMGSGTTLAVAEGLGRKWIGSDLGRFGVHTSRKRLIEVQRKLKNAGGDYRAFEILNLGKYERKHFAKVEGDIRDDAREILRKRKEEEFKTLILSAYRAEPLTGFETFVGKKRDRLVAIGPIEHPVANGLIEEVIDEASKKGITKVDVLGFEWEMGIDFTDAKRRGVDIQFKTIPNEVFDRRAIERGQVKFYDVAYLEAKPIVKKNSFAIELTDFTVFYNQDDIAEVEQTLKGGSSKIVLENGHVIKITKDKKTDLFTREILTQKWTDWIDYWAVDFNYENKKEIVRNENGEEEWTGQYIFENEWQSFRTRKNRELDLTSAFMECGKGRRKVAVKVIDIFGNDTTKIVEVLI